jgi:hypothetical protein
MMCSKEMAKLESDLTSIHGCIVEIQQISESFFDSGGQKDLPTGQHDYEKLDAKPMSPLSKADGGYNTQRQGAADFKTLTENIEGIKVLLQLKYDSNADKM